MLYFLYKLLSILPFGIVILFVLYLFVQKKFFRRKKYILFCFVCGILVNLIFWCFTFISLNECTYRLYAYFYREGPIYDTIKEDILTTVGQKPTDVSYSTDPNGNTKVIVIYKYNFPPFNDCFKFTFINDNLTEQRHTQRGVEGAVGGFLAAISGNVIVDSIIGAVICAAIAVIVSLTVRYYLKCQ